MNKRDHLQALREADAYMEKVKDEVQKHPWRQDYHYSPTVGWINDPCGLVQIDGYYHMLCQHYPFSGAWGMMYLSHARSKDLVHWEQIGHGIHRPDQLDYKNCETSEGLWAPSIRYHNGTFYIINTFVSKGREADRDNYIITAKNPAGPWSDPVFVEGADGIDSSLFFDDDGSVWYVGNFISSECLYEGHHGIYLNELDPVTLQFKGERRIIWDGKKTYSRWIEAPHIYKKTAGITCWLQKAVPLSTTVCRWPAAVPLTGITRYAPEIPL